MADHDRLVVSATVQQNYANREVARVEIYAVWAESAGVFSRGLPVVHFRVHLRCWNANTNQVGTEHITIDTLKEAGDPLRFIPIDVHVEVRPTPFSNRVRASEFVAYTMDPPQYTNGYRVRDVIALIRHYRLHHYQYNPEGYGCKHWCETFIECMIDDGYLPQNSLQGFETWWRTLRVNLGRTAWLIEDDKGEFEEEE